MKQLTLLILLLYISTGTKAQIMNGSFEVWHTGISNFEEPDFWATNNSSGFSGVTKDSTNMMDGHYSMKIGSSGEASAVFITSGDYWISAYCSGQAHNNVWPSIKYIGYRNGIASNGFETIVGQKGQGYWELIDYYFPLGLDSIRVVCHTGNDSSAFMNIDQLELRRLRTATVSSLSESVVSLSPNPATDHATLSFTNSAGRDFRLTVRDNSGAIVYRSSTRTEKFMIGRSDLPGGFYYWKIDDAAGITFDKGSLLFR
jgi:hypothetical protein